MKKQKPHLEYHIGYKYSFSMKFDRELGESFNKYIHSKLLDKFSKTINKYHVFPKIFYKFITRMDYSSDVKYD